MIRRLAGVILLILLVAAASHLAAVERLKLNVSPLVAFAPANLVVRASIEPDAENRAVEVEAESSAFKVDEQSCRAQDARKEVIMSEVKRPNLLLHLALLRRQPPGSLLTSFSN